MGLLVDRRIPLELYRGRTIYAAPVQAAELVVRSVTACDGLADLRLVSHDGGVVAFSTPLGMFQVHVEEGRGPAVAVSCGAEPEPTARWAATRL